MPEGNAYACDYCCRTYALAQPAGQAIAQSLERASTPEFEAARAEVEMLMPQVEQRVAEYTQAARGVTDPVDVQMQQLADKKVRARIAHARDAIAAKDLAALRDDIEKLKVQMMLFATRPRP